MKSRASVLGHPLHAMLVPFPFAFLSGAVAFDLVGVAFARPQLPLIATYLAGAGIATALLAAVPGVIDGFHTVPPRSSGRKRVLLHMTLNLTAVVLFAISWLLRSGALIDQRILLLEVCGIALLGVGGWMGGTLVYRNQIGIDHRYADAGKWREATVTARAGDVAAVGQIDELKVDQMKLIWLNRDRLVLARTAEGHVAFEDRCTHRGGSLADGCLIGGVVQCPWHGSQFDTWTGRVKCGPATQDIATRPATIEGDTINVPV